MVHTTILFENCWTLINMFSHFFMCWYFHTTILNRLFTWRRWQRHLNNISNLQGHRTHFTCFHFITPADRRQLPRWKSTQRAGHIAPVFNIFRLTPTRFLNRFQTFWILFLKMCPAAFLTWSLFNWPKSGSKRFILYCFRTSRFKVFVMYLSDTE